MTLPGTDFTSGGWDNAESALAEVDSMLADLRRGVLPDRLWLLFAPTIALQEVSRGNGWSEQYMELATRFDAEFAKYKQQA